MSFAVNCDPNLPAQAKSSCQIIKDTAHTSRGVQGHSRYATPAFAVTANLPLQCHQQPKPAIQSSSSNHKQVQMAHRTIDGQQDLLMEQFKPRQRFHPVWHPLPTNIHSVPFILQPDGTQQPKRQSQRLWVRLTDDPLHHATRAGCLHHQTGRQPTPGPGAQQANRAR